MLHIALHLLAPALIVAVFFRKRWWQSYLLLLAGLAIDVDHLLATPIYDPLRCSIGFHPLHTWPATVVYAALCAHRRTRLLGIGFLLHLVLDVSDCAQMPGGIDKLRALSVPEVVAEARKAVIDAGGKQRQGADSQCAAQVLREYQ